MGKYLVALSYMGNEACRSKAAYGNTIEVKSLLGFAVFPILKDIVAFCFRLRAYEVSLTV